MLKDDEIDRYARHLVLKEIGGSGQLRLKAARVALVGAGGIGSPAALYLTAAGVGQIGLIDNDVVALSNLQRQVLFTTNDIGDAKVEVAASRLKDLNPNVTCQAFLQRLDQNSAKDLLSDFDIVLDGSDNFETRLLVNTVCHTLGIPLVSAALGRFSGQLATFHGTPCYQCLMPEIPPDAETCERVGIVGALAGILGSMAALEVIKLITGAGETLKGKILMVDGLTWQCRLIRQAADPLCPVCHPG